ncbi:MAG: protein kinase [Chloroflexota bacterium]
MNQILCTNPACRRTNRLGAKFCSGCGQTLTSSLLLQPVSQLAGGTMTGRLPTHAKLQDRYLIVEKVGQGGQGAVYKAVDTDTKQILAIKEMSIAEFTNPQERAEAVQRFTQEAKLLRGLRHPNLPFVVDQFTTGERHYLAMEYVEGKTLQELLESQGRAFAEEELLPWAHQLCDVLAYLHQQKPPIIFRDLKPDNIMLTESGQIKLIDFGIARIFKPGKRKDTIALGTQGFAAPEQFGKGQTEVRSDVYALGVTLLCLLTGQDPPVYPPFHSPKEMGIDVSEDTDKLIRKATTLDIRERWSTMQLMQAQLPGSGSTGVGTTAVSSTTQKISGQPKIKTSRLTTQMLLKAADYTPQQLLRAGFFLLLAIILAVWIITPYIVNSWLWFNVPTIAIIAPFAFAATRKQWSAAASHALVTLVGGIIVWTQANVVTDINRLFIGAVVSALAVEGVTRFLPAVLGTRTRDDPGAWEREIALLGGTAIVGHIVLSLIASTAGYAFNLIAWMSAFLLGSVGWFAGDLIQGYLFLQQTGVKWRQ